MLLPIDSSISYFTVATLPNPATMVTGTIVAVSDYGGNVAVAVNGMWRFEFPFRTTWVGRPAAGLVPAGTELQVTDYGDQKWISDGVHWRPAQGRALIYSRVADSISTPIATLSAVGVFALPGGSPVIPAGMIAPQTKVCVCSQFRKYGSSNFVTAEVKIGTAGDASDPYMSRGRLNNINGVDLKAVGFAYFGSLPTKFVTGGWVPENSGNWGNVFDEQTSNVNTAVDMLVSPSITTITDGDTAILLSHQVWLEG